MSLVRCLDRSISLDSEGTVRLGKLNGAHRTLFGLHRSIRGYSAMNLNFQRLSSEVKYIEWLNEPTRRVVLVLPIIHGCSWKRRTGGCFNCGMAQGLGVHLPSVLFIKSVVDKIAAWTVNQEAPPTWVCVYNEGSYLNSEELPLQAQQLILRTIAGVESVKRVTIEARPEFITEAALKWLKDIALSYEIEIEIGIGVEVGSDFIRKYCINKGFSWRVFEGKVNAMAKHGIRSLAYVLLKPPFLTEREAINESVKTIEECFRVGVNAVSLEPMSIQEWTIVEYLWLTGVYKLPALWSVVEVVYKVAGLGEVRIGGEPVTYYPHSLLATHNCETCSERVWRRIRLYNETHDLQHLAESYCQCREEWWRMINKDVSDTENLEYRVAERILAVAQSPLSLEDYLKRKILAGGKNHYD